MKLAKEAEEMKNSVTMQIMRIMSARVNQLSVIKYEESVVEDEKGDDKGGTVNDNRIDGDKNKDESRGIGDVSDLKENKFDFKCQNQP